MSVSTLRKPDKIILAGTEFQQFETQGVDAGVTDALVYPAGHPHALNVSTRMVQPILEFDTPQIDQVVGNIPITGLASATDSYLYFAQAAASGITGKTARASLVHDRYVLSQIVAYWTTIRLPNRGQGIAHVVVCAVYDGTNVPVVHAGTLALSGNLTVAKEFGVGPASITIAGPTAVAMEPTEITINSGVELHKESCASELYDTFVGIKMADPSVEISSLSKLAVENFTLAGSNLDGTTGLVAYARQIGPRVSDATAAHIKIDAADGVVYPGRATTADGRWTDSVRIRLIANDATVQPITFTTGSTIA